MAPVPARGGVPAPRPLYAGQPRTHEAEDLDKLSQAVFEPETWNFQHDLHKVQTPLFWLLLLFTSIPFIM